MHTIEEKRVYADRSGAAACFVASGDGLVRARVAGGTVGEFSLVDRRPARDVAAGGAAENGDSAGSATGSVAVATDEDVLLGPAEAAPATDESDGDEPAFEPTDFGPAAAVGFRDGALLAAGPDGRVGQYRPNDGTWATLDGPTDLAVRAIDGPLVATDAGVFRVRDGALTPAGLDDVRDVSAAGVPLAATADGVYALGNGWMVALGASAVGGEPPESTGDGPHSDGFRAVATASDGDRAYAAAGRTIFERVDGEWDVATEAEDPVVGLAVGAVPCAVTRRGTLLAAGAGPGDGDAVWRPTPLGVRDVGGVAVASTPDAD